MCQLCFPLQLLWLVNRLFCILAYYLVCQTIHLFYNSFLKEIDLNKKPVHTVPTVQTYVHRVPTRRTYVHIVATVRTNIHAIGNLDTSFRSYSLQALRRHLPWGLFMTRYHHFSQNYKESQREICLMERSVIEYCNASAEETFQFLTLILTEEFHCKIRLIFR